MPLFRTQNRTRGSHHIPRFLWRVLPFASIVTLTACGGGGGGGGGSQGPVVTAPTVVLTSSSATVANGDPVTLDWQSVNTDSCTASNGWSGDKATSGSETIASLSASTTFTLSCSGAGGSVSADLLVSVGTSSGTPTVSLTVSPETVPLDGEATLSWTTSDVSACSASGAWSGDVPLNGTAATGALTSDAAFELTCTSSSGDVSDTTSVRVLAANLSWLAPDSNVDGSTLSDLAGYRVYWGTSPRTYTETLDISDPSVTSVDVGVDIGTYYFAMTAIDSAGDESRFSNELSKTFQ